MRRLFFLVVSVFLTVFGLVAASSVPALAAPPAVPSLAAQARAYAKAHNLPIREVPLDVPGREGVKRIFVPVTDATHDDFVKMFTKSGVIVRQPGDAFGVEHVHVALEPNDVMEYGRLGGGGQVVPPSSGGLYVALALSPEQKAYFKQNAPNAPRDSVNGRSTGCMYWLSNGCTAPNQPFGHNYGIKRSSAPSNLVKKLIHAGNEAVIVGVPISENDQNTHQVRQQVAAYDAAIDQAKAQIENYENQGGGGRIKAFQTESAPFHEALDKADAAIAARADQPRIVAGLESRRREIQRDLRSITAEHEAPYRQRMTELRQTMSEASRRLTQARAAHADGVKAASDLLAAREKEHAQLVRLAPKPDGSNRHSLKVLEFDRAITGVEEQVAQVKANHAANRAGWQDQIDAAQKELDGLADEIPLQPRGQSGGALTQRVAQLRQQIDEYEGYMKSPQYSDQQKAQWRPTLEQLRITKTTLTKLGARRYDGYVEQRVANAASNIAQGRVQLAALDGQGDADVVGLVEQIDHLKQSRAVIVTGGAKGYHPEYDQELARLNVEIAQHESELANHQHVPDSIDHVVQTRSALASLVAARKELLSSDPAEFNPAYQQRLDEIDQSKAQLEGQIAQYKNDGRYAANVQQWRAEIQEHNRERAKITKIGPRDYNPAYGNRLAQIDQQIEGLKNNVAAYPGPQYAANRQPWNAQIRELRQQRASVVAAGPRGYDPEYDAKLAQASNELANAKQHLAATKEQLGGELASARTEVALAKSLRAELEKHGALKYNEHYEQRLSDLDTENAELASYLRSPQYNDAQKGAWKAQIAQNEAIKKKLLEKGPENYSQYEPQIEALREQIEQHHAAAAPLRQQLALADAAANKGAALKARFKAISDQDLMGAPPGGGAAEAVHK